MEERGREEPSFVNNFTQRVPTPRLRRESSRKPPSDWKSKVMANHPWVSVGPNEIEMWVPSISGYRIVFFSPVRV